MKVKSTKLLKKERYHSINYFTFKFIICITVSLVKIKIMIFFSRICYAKSQFLGYYHNVTVFDRSLCLKL